MKAVVFHGKDDIRIENVKVPEIGENEILLRVHAASICGTDLKIISNGHFKIPDGETRILGHEMAGEITAVGSEVKHLGVGTRISVAPNIGCGICNECVGGNTNLCQNYGALGITLDGAFAEYVRIPSQYIQQGNIFCLPDSVTYEEASLAEPLSTIINGSEACNIKPADIVLVIGAGPIGILHLMFAKIRGAQRVIVSELLNERREQVRRFGADFVIDPSKDDLKGVLMELSYGRGPDVIIVAAPSAKAQESSLELIARGGRINFFGGLIKGQEIINFNSNLIHYKQVYVTGTTGSNIMQYRRAMELIISRRINVSSLISAKFSLDRAHEAFKRAESKKDLKILFNP